MKTINSITKGVPLMIILVGLIFASTAMIFKDGVPETKEKKKVLIVLTSHNKIESIDRPTGYWYEEMTVPYYYFTDRGFEVDFASPKGGKPPVDPASLDAKYIYNEASPRFDKDKKAQRKIAKSMLLTEVNTKDYAAVIYPGGYGPMFDLAKDLDNKKIVEEFYNSNKPVVAFCHGPAALILAEDKNGNSILAGKKVAGFKNSEEAADELVASKLPFSLENKLKSLGARYESGDDWQGYAVSDGLLITGQNPASAEKVAELVFQKIGKDADAGE